MRRILVVLVWVALTAALAEAGYLQPEVEYAQNRFIIKLYPDVGNLDPSPTADGVRVFDAALTALNSTWGVTKIERLFEGPAPKESPELDLPGYWRFWLNREVTYAQLESLLNDYSKANLVEHVEPVGIHRLNYSPNDPAWTNQWFTRNTAADHDIDAYEGWNIERGDSSAILGITDTGVLYNHPDLQAHIWHNWAEVNGISGADDDGNGFVDDSIGWDFVSAGSSCWSGEDCTTPDNDPKDFNGHGTHCSGIAAAVTNNSVGGAGIAGGGGTYSGAKVMALRVGWSASYLGSEVGYVGMDYAAQAINYGRVKGVCAFNCSWGSSNSGGLGAAIAAANNAGIVFCVAAGNDNTNSQVDNYLSTRNDCIDVAASTSGDLKASFSNYGTWVDVTAPGANIYSTVSNHYTASYAYYDGTSMAAPCVVGEVGLLKSHNPTWTRTQIIPAITGNVDDIDALNPSYTGQLGSGRINVNLALLASGSITLTSPVGGEIWYTGESHAITWTSSGFTGNVKIEVNRSYPGGTWETLFASITNDGTENWTVSGTVSTTARIRVSSVTTPTVFDESNANFTIGVPFLTLTSPNGGETWYTGESHAITWSGAGFTGNVKLELNRSYSGGVWETLFANTANDGTEAWTVAGSLTGAARIRVTSVGTPALTDVSDANFTLAAPSITVMVPNGGDSWSIGIDYLIQWTSAGFTGNVKVELNRAYPGGTWEVLDAGTANTGGLLWTVTAPSTNLARIRLTSVANPAITDLSDNNFVLAGTPPILNHDALCDFAPGGGEITATSASVTSAIASVKMFFRPAGGGSFDSLNLTASGHPSEYMASLAALTTGSYEYYVRAADAVNLTSTVPMNAPAELYLFRVGMICSGELAYDDGSAEKFNYPIADSAGFQFAVKFGPVQTPFVLCGARFAASRTLPDNIHTPVRVLVYAADGIGGMPGTLIQDVQCGSVGNAVGGLPAGTNWAQAILRNDAGDPLEITSPEFYVALSNVMPGRIEAFGRDTTGVNAHRSVLFDPCQNRWISEDDTSSTAHAGNRLIRAQGYALLAPVAVINRNGTTVDLHWTRTGAPAYAVYSSPLVGGPFGFIQSTTDTFFSISGIDTASAKTFFQIRSVAP
jgi:subtilisin family serine protease